MPQRSGAADLVMPSKLTGLPASDCSLHAQRLLAPHPANARSITRGRAILATAGPETQLSYVLEGCGLVVPPESPETVAEGLRRLADDPALRARLGAAGRAYAEEHLAKEPVLTRFLERLQGEVGK